MDSDDLVMLMHVMSLNNGVLRPRDHPNSRATLARLVRSGAIVIILLCGGHKGSQGRDIEEAKRIAREWKE